MPANAISTNGNSGDLLPSDDASASPVADLALPDAAMAAVNAVKSQSFPRSCAVCEGNHSFDDCDVLSDCEPLKSCVIKNQLQRKNWLALFVPVPPLSMPFILLLMVKTILMMDVKWAFFTMSNRIFAKTIEQLFVLILPEIH